MKLHHIGTLLTMVLLFGCSRSSGLLSPSMERDMQYFPFGHQELFGPSTMGQSEFTPHFNDVDLGQIRGVANQAEIVSIAGHGCAAVTLYRPYDDDVDYFDMKFKPIFRWLDASLPDINGDPRWVTNFDFVQICNGIDYRGLSCAAIYDDGQGSIVINDAPSTPAIELAVAYQYREPLDPGPGFGQWKIGLTRLLWYGNDLTYFWLKQPTVRKDYNDLDLHTGTIPNTKADIGEIAPDIAYNCENGDIYMVFVNLNSATIARVNYRKYRRGSNSFGSEYFSQTQDHNGWDPSVDVGLVSVIPPPAPPLNCVAVTYTSQYQGGHMGYHVCAAGWDTGQIDMDQYSISIMNPLPPYEFKDAGLSQVDIAPKANSLHFATCTYTQVTGDDWYGPITGVAVVNYFGYISGHLVLDISDAPPDDPEHPLYRADSLYSSIAINNSTVSPIFASISCLGQEPESETLHPVWAKVRLDPGHLSVDSFDWVDTILPIVSGNYNISDIPYQNPGVASAIVLWGANQMYWAAWADRIEMEPPPQAIYGAYGWAGN